MPQHFLGLADANILATTQYQLTDRIIRDLIAHAATGVIHGPAGAGKTFAMQAGIETQRRIAGEDRISAYTLAFPSRPSMLRVAADLIAALTGATPPTSRNRFQLVNQLIGLLSGTMKLIVVDEAQRLNSDCIELLRHLHDHPETRFALLYVGGDGCWEVLSREPMLRSRIFRRLPFRPLPHEAIPGLIRAYHPIYDGADDALLLDIDNTFAKGVMRDWAVLTHTAADLCRDTGQDRISEAIVANAYALLGGGLHD